MFIVDIANASYYNISFVYDFKAGCNILHENSSRC